MNSKAEHRKYCKLPEGIAPELGDVRRCEHGIVQVNRHSLGGLVYGVWIDLHPFWDFFPYRRAVKKLAKRPETMVHKKKPVIDSSWGRRMDEVDWDIDMNLPVYTKDLIAFARYWTFDGKYTLAEVIEQFANDVGGPNERNVGRRG